MIILDTNVVSEFMKSQPDATVVEWLDRQPAASVWTTAITVFEVEFGLQRMPRGKRRTLLETAFAEMISADLNGRVLSFDTNAALAAGALCASFQSLGRTMEIRDAQIASIARVRSATVATGNTKHFAQACDVLDPWQRG